MILLVESYTIEFMLSILCRCAALCRGSMRNSYHAQPFMHTQGFRRVENPELSSHVFKSDPWHGGFEWHAFEIVFTGSSRGQFGVTWANRWHSKLCILALLMPLQQGSDMNSKGTARILQVSVLGAHPARWIT